MDQRNARQTQKARDVRSVIDKALRYVERVTGTRRNRDARTHEVFVTQDGTAIPRHNRD